LKYADTNVLVSTEEDGFPYHRFNWAGSEQTPARVRISFPWPVKFLEDWRSAWGRSIIAVRTDAYPLWWMVVWLRLRIEEIADHDFADLMRVANAIGIAETKPGYIPHLRDFRWSKKLRNPWKKP
jgi:hypothetical protein